MASGEHSSRQYDQELEAIRSRVLQMGGLVESQLKLALDAFEYERLDMAEQAVAADDRVDAAELEIDGMVNNVIARRQPTAGDLRMIMGVAKTIIDLERIGDEASKVARAVKWLHDKPGAAGLGNIPDIRNSGAVAAQMLHRTLDAFARLDPVAAAAIIRDDEDIDVHFRAILRQLITFVLEDPRTITASLDTVWVAKAIERVGDHAKNIAEHVIFIAQGEDVRHASREEIERIATRG